MILETALLERLTARPDYEHIVIGTGTLARSMRKILLLLGLKAPFMIGFRTTGDEILGYDEIARLGDPNRFRFITCCELDEWELLAPAQMAAYKFLGCVVSNHPQVIEISNYEMRCERSGIQLIDAMNGNAFLRDGKPYLLYGDSGANFIIHTAGECILGGNYEHTSHTPASVLYELLMEAGFECAVYAWGQPISPGEDGIIRLIRDIWNYKCNLLISTTIINVMNPLSRVTRNILATRAGTLDTKHPFIRRCEARGEPNSNGANYDISLPELRRKQQRICAALTRQKGFVYWEILPPNIELLPEKHIAALLGSVPARAARRKANKAKLIAALDPAITKDYSDIFDDANDIHAMFSDAIHFSDAGNRLFAKRLAAEILAEFRERKGGLIWKN